MEPRDQRWGRLSDIAILTGAQVVSAQFGLKLENVVLEDLGEAKRVQVTTYDTTIIDGVGRWQDVKQRGDEICAQIEEATSNYDKEKMQERFAKLAGGVAIIKVGAATIAELKARKLRTEKAASAFQAWLWDGTTPNIARG